MVQSSNSQYTAALDIADSGQQPTADVDKLVNEISEMLMDMKIKLINQSSYKLFFETILLDLPSLFPEVRAERLRKFVSMLRNKMPHHNIADQADTPDRSNQSATIDRPATTAMRTHGEDGADAGMPCKTVWRTARLLPVLALCERRQRQM